MQIDFLTVLIAVVSLIILAVPGYILAKVGFFPEKAGEVCSTLVLYGCQPMLVFMGFQGKRYSSDILLNMLIVAALVFVIHLIMIGIVSICIRGKGDEAKKRVVRAASVFGNCGYMGMPFIQMLFSGSEYFGEIVVYTAVVISIFNIMNWTFGVYMLTGDKKNISIKKILLNPTIIAVVLGFVVFVTLKVPIVELAAPGTPANMILNKLVQSFNYLGDMVTPLAMIVIGIRLANVKFKQLFADKWTYLICFNKLIIMSIVTIICVLFLPISEQVKYVIFFSLSMPCATSTALFAIQFGGDGDFASISVLLSTILSILTIPLMFLLFNLLI